MTTLTEVEHRYGVSHLDHLDKEVALPTVDRLAFQGDVAIVRNDKIASTDPIPEAGYPVVKGENGGNTHAVFGKGFFTPGVVSATNLVLGTLTVPADEEVLLSHPEHGGMIIAPGSYEVRRQREQADELRMVAD